MAWDYSDYVTEEYGSTRLTKFRAHIKEVSDKLTAEIGEGPTAHSTHALQRYLDKLKADEPNEKRRCDAADAANSQFFRGRSVLK